MVVLRCEGVRADEAWPIAERSGYVLQGAGAHLELARLALARGDRETAREHAQEAHQLATCDGPPDYTYKTAYVEAEALLKQFGLVRRKTCRGRRKAWRGTGAT